MESMPQRARRQPSLFAADGDVTDPPDPSDVAVETDGPQPAPLRHEGLYVGVAMELAIDQVLTYSVPPALRSAIAVGQRIKAPLGRGNRSTYGYVVEITNETGVAGIKPILAIDDRRVLLDTPLMDLARWMSRYYICPLGAVMENIIPTAVRKRVGVGYLTMVRLAISRDEAQAALEKCRTPKRRGVLGRLLQLPEGESIELARLAGEANVTPATVRKLRQPGWIRIEDVPDLPSFGVAQGSGGKEPGRELNDDQQRVFDELRPLLGGGFGVNLLMGVTGSGKTEIYLQAIRAVVDAGRQAIVLVPEIALTPQTVQRFKERFSRIAVMHSGLGATQRHKFWQQVIRGDADVVIGARSAIFAPTPRLGLIVVDEEHEASYKQDQSPRYQARDVAIKRAQIHGIPILLGSATPSLEMYHRVLNAGPGGAYRLLTLPNRVRGLKLPHVEVVDLSVEYRLRRTSHLISARLEHLLRATLESKRQAILLLNRRGYANFVNCRSCGHVVNCKYCDTTLTYHRTIGAPVSDAKLVHGVHTGQLHCHYCLAVNPLPAACPECGKGLSLFGLGTQRVEEELKKKFPDLRFARVDSDAMRSGGDYERTLARFGSGELQVLLGTQMIAKGLDFPNVALVGVINGDTALALPDFRAGERTFQLITQVAGRAGRGDTPGRVVLQTFMKDEPAIRFAIAQDYLAFAAQELANRKLVGLPPVTRMVRIILRDQDAETLAGRADELAAELSRAAAGHGEQVTLRGPMPCPISRIAGYHRYQIVLTSPSAGRLAEILGTLRQAKRLNASDRVAVDVDPVSLL